MGEIRASIARAVAAGYKEIAITGVHLGSYGRDPAERGSLMALARELADWPGDVLFRVSSLEPMDCGPEFVDLVAASPRLAPHFHLLQHSSDDLLRAMRRLYSFGFYCDLVAGIRERMPHASSVPTSSSASRARPIARRPIWPNTSSPRRSPTFTCFRTRIVPHTEASGMSGLPVPPRCARSARGARRQWPPVARVSCLAGGRGATRAGRR